MVKKKRVGTRANLEKFSEKELVWESGNKPRCTECLWCEMTRDCYARIVMQDEGLRYMDGGICAAKGSIFI